MKTALEIYNEVHKDFSKTLIYNDSEIILFAMKMYAKQCAQQALNDAAENALLNISSFEGFGSFDTALYSDGDGDTVSVNKESITQTEILTP